MSDEMIDDEFETVAVTWSQPEAAVMMAMFEFYGIPAFALGARHVASNPPLMTALQGIQVRVHHTSVDEALDLLAEVAEQPAVVRPYILGRSWLYRTIIALAIAMPFLSFLTFYFLGEPPLIAVVLAIFLSFIWIGVPMPRTPSTFMLWKRSHAAPA